jgi:hypothetical protein
MQVLMQDKFNIFVNLTNKEWTESRRIIIDIILGTDMVNHQKQISNTLVRGCSWLVIPLPSSPHTHSPHLFFRIRAVVFGNQRRGD